MPARSRLVVAPLVSLLAWTACRTEAPAPPVPPAATAMPFSPGAGSDEIDDLDELELPAVEGDATVQAIVELGHTDNRVMQHLRHLTEEIGPRLTGSHGLMEAERWCEDAFASWGLSASLERWGEVPVGFDRGPWSGGMVAPQTIAYDFTTLAWTPGTFEAVPGPAVPYPRSRAEAKSRRKELAGAWVVRPRDLASDRAELEKIDALLAEAGVAGIVRGDRDESGALVHTWGRSQLEWGELPEHLSIVLRGDQHADLLARLERDEPVRLAFSVDNRFFRGPVPQHNVVAELPGTDLADQLVIVGGHLDSWDGATGANDNGTGVATTMEAARLLAAAGARPRRTIRFVLWTGEEQGLLGSKGYAERHAEEMERTSAVFVHDMGTNYLSGIGITPEMRPQLEPALAPLAQLAPDSMPFVLREAEGLEPGGSDHTPFIRAGVPGFFWDQAGDSDYARVHHTQHDTIDNVIEEYQRHSAMVVALAAYRVANLPDLVERRNSAPIPRRRLGVAFGSGLAIDGIRPGSVAAEAGWKRGDVVVSIDGAEVGERDELRSTLQSGGPTKTVVIQRGGKPVTTTLDWSGAQGEDEREARRRARASAGAR